MNPNSKQPLNEHLPSKPVPNEGRSNGCLVVQERPIAGLRPFAGNARTHSKKQIRQIAQSIKSFGFTNPVLIDDDGVILCGHGRVEAAKLLGMVAVPAIALRNMSETDKRAYIIADNRLAELAGWDADLLKLEIGFLIESELDFAVETIGFDTADIDLLFANDDAPAEAEEDIELPDKTISAVTCSGDQWIIGEHRLFCGDARDPASYTALLGTERAEMVFTDAPYNVRVADISGLGKTKHREFAMASGEMSRSAFTAFLREAMTCMIEVSSPGAIHFLCMDWRGSHALLDAADGIYAEQKNLCVWNKTNAGMGTFYRSRHELIYVMKVGNVPHINNFGLGSKGRYRSNVWTYAGVNTFRKGRAKDLEAHPTVKPTKMVIDAILDCSHRGGIILDAFTGSGTTLLAAARTGRHGRGIEIDPHYCDLIIRRLEAVTGATAALADGTSFDQLRARRLSARKDAA